MNVKYSLLGLFLALANIAVAQQLRCDTIHTTVNFERGYSTVDLDYADNRSALKSLSDSLRSFASDPALFIQSILVRGAASPDGFTSKNAVLSEKRARNIVRHLVRATSLPDTIFSIEAAGVDWRQLEQMVDTSSMPYKEEVLEIIRTTPQWVFNDGRIVDSRKRRLGMLHGGRPYNYMSRNFFPTLRNADFCTVVCMTQLNIPPSDTYSPTGSAEPDAVPESSAPKAEMVAMESGPETTTVDTDGNTGALQTSTSSVPVVTQSRGVAFPLAIKTNMLYDIAAVPNLAVEFAFLENYSVSLGGMYAWWSNEVRHRYWRVRGGEFELRRWWNPSCPDGQRWLTGHHFGLYAQLLDYDFEFGGPGQQSDGLNYGVGLSYGYSLSLNSRFNIDFVLGVGWLGGKYKKYHPADDCYVWTSTNNRFWIGPTKAEISLVYKFGSECKKKGGRK